MFYNNDIQWNEIVSATDSIVLIRMKGKFFFLISLPLTVTNTAISLLNTNS